MDTGKLFETIRADGRAQNRRSFAIGSDTTHKKLFLPQIINSKWDEVIKKLQKENALRDHLARAGLRKRRSR